MDKIQNPHDSLFKETWSNKANAKAFLENYLPGTLLEIADLDSLEICKDTFIENDLKDYYSDMLYKVNFKGTIMARVVMLIFKHVFDPKFADKLPGIFSLIRDLSEKETGLQYFESLIKYIFSNVEDITAEQFQIIVSNTLSEDKGDVIMALADKLRNEGRVQGLEQGRVQGLEQGRVQGREQGIELGLLEGLEFAVSIKFGDTDDSKTLITKIKSIKDINTLKALKGKIKSASTAPELLSSIED